MNQTQELCGIRSDAFRLAACPFYVRLIHNASSVKTCCKAPR